MLLPNVKIIMLFVLTKVITHVIW